MAYPNSNEMGYGLAHRVHINPNFRGRIACAAGNGDGGRPVGIHVNPHWKPKTDGNAANEYNVAAVTTAEPSVPPHLEYSQRRTIHINPKVIASMGPESLSKLVKQENICKNSISGVSTGYVVNLKPPPISHIPDEKVTIQELSSDLNIIGVKPGKMDCKENKSFGHMFKYKRSVNNTSSPIVRIAKTLRSKYKYLNHSVSSHPSVYCQDTIRRYTNEKQTNSFSSWFKYIKKSDKEIPMVQTPGIQKNRHAISRYKFVKQAVSPGTGIKPVLASHSTPRRSKAVKGLENVKNIHDHRMKTQYRGSKGANVAPRPLSTYKHNTSSNVPKTNKSNSRFKFVRLSPTVQRTPLKKRSPRTVTSRYKIVRKTTQNSETPRTTRFRVVRNNSSTPAYRQKILQQRPSLSAFRHRWMHYRLDLPATRVTVTKKKLLRIGQRPTNRPCSGDVMKKAKLLNIGGVFYRSTRTTLTRSAGANSLKSTANKALYHVKGQILSIRGSKFILDKTGKTLQRLSPNAKTSSDLSRIHIGGVTFVRASEDTLVRSRVHEARNLVSQAKQKSIAVLTSKLRKNNQPCVIYQRFGKCRLYEKGNCPRVHDPKTVAVCNDFVNGKCLKSAAECSLSHNIGPEKMPTCHFFLEGCCVRDPCPYLHVKLNRKAAVCRDFLSGYCNAGDKCKKRHVFLCPEFEERKTCSKGKYCKYRHAGTPKSKGSRANKSKEDIRAEGRTHEESSQLTTQPEEKADALVRYYVSGERKKTPAKKPRLSGREGGTNRKRGRLSNKDDGNVPERDTVKVLRPKRSKLGDLPGYIPL